MAGIDVGSNEAVGNSCCASSDILHGRFLNPKGEKGVMVEEAYAKAHHTQVDQKVSVAGTQFPVVGIINSGIRPAKADMYMPYAEAERVVNSPHVTGEQVQHRFNALLVEVLNSQVQDKAMKDVKALEPSMVVSTYACYIPAAQVMGMNATGIRILVLLVMLGVVLFAAKSQFASVVEPPRRHRRAQGDRVERPPSGGVAPGGVGHPGVDRRAAGRLCGRDCAGDFGGHRADGRCGQQRRRPVHDRRDPGLGTAAGPVGRDPRRVGPGPLVNQDQPGRGDSETVKRNRRRWPLWPRAAQMTECRRSET